MTFPAASRNSPLKLTILEVLPELKWSRVTDIADRSRSGADKEEGGVPPGVAASDVAGVEGVGVWRSVGVWR